MLAWAANSGGGGKVRPSCMSASIVAASATSLTLVLLLPRYLSMTLHVINGTCIAPAKNVPASTETLPPWQEYCQQQDHPTRGVVGITVVSFCPPPIAYWADAATRCARTSSSSAVFTAAGGGGAPPSMAASSSMRSGPARGPTPGGGRAPFMGFGARKG